MGTSGIYRLTQVGRRVASTSRPTGRDHILDHLYTTRTASEDELVQIAGGTAMKYRIKSHIRKLIHRGLIEEVGGSRDFY